MKTSNASKGFPLPSSLKVVPGTENAQAAYPYTMQFGKGDDTRFWFYNSMHFPEPMSAFDMVTAEAAYCALGAANTRVHCLPTTLGIDYRVINGRVYIGGNAVTDPAEIARRTEEFQKRAFYYYANWERLYAQWREKMMALIHDAQALPTIALPEFEPLEHVHAGRGIASNHGLLDTYQRTLEGYFRMWHHHFEFLHALGLEILERGIPIERRNLRTLFEPLRATLGTAGAPFGAAYASALDDDPAGATTPLANGLRGHYSYYRADAHKGRIGFAEGRAGGSPRAERAVRTRTGLLAVYTCAMWRGVLAGTTFS